MLKQTAHHRYLLVAEAKRVGCETANVLAFMLIDDFVQQSGRPVVVALTDQILDGGYREKALFQRRIEVVRKIAAGEPVRQITIVAALSTRRKQKIADKLAITLVV